MTIQKIIKCEKALTLIEALISLAIVGTGMVIVTNLSFRAMRQARMNELQDVAIQAGVEAVDYMKSPGALNADALPASGTAGMYYIDEADFSLRQTTQALEANETSCNESSVYAISSLFESNYQMCQQINITPKTGDRYDYEVIIVWKTLGDKFETRSVTGFRVDEIELAAAPAQGPGDVYTPTVVIQEIKPTMATSYTSCNYENFDGLFQDPPDDETCSTRNCFGYSSCSKPFKIYFHFNKMFKLRGLKIFTLWAPDQPCYSVDVETGVNVPQGGTWTMHVTNYPLSCNADYTEVPISVDNINYVQLTFDTKYSTVSINEIEFAEETVIYSY